MLKKLKIATGDTVEIIAGSDKGLKGAVLDVKRKTTGPLRIKVQGVKMMTHFDEKEGKHQKEGFIDFSNVKLVSKAKASGKKSKKS